MSSMKCPQCGLINWVTAEACKRCKLQFDAAASGPPAPTPTGDDAQAPDAEVGDQAHAGAADGHPQTTGVYGEPQEPFLYDATPGHGPAGHAHASWRSPYDVDGGAGPDAPANTLDIDFEVAPFVDTSMTIRDTYYLSRSQLGLIARVVLTAIAPHALLILAFGTGLEQASAALPAGQSFFGAPPTAAGGADLNGLFSFFLLTLIVYHFVRWAVMPSALVYGLVKSLNTGETPGLWECYRWGLRRSVSGGLALLLSVVLSSIGLIFLIVPGIILAVCFTVVVPVAAIEGCSAIEAMRRSLHLTRGRRATIFASTLAWSVLAFLFTLLTSLLAGLLAGVLRSDVIGSIATLAVSELLAATGIVLTLVIYLGLAHYKEVSHPGAYSMPTGTPSGGPGGFDVQGGGGWGPQPAFAAAGGFAPASSRGGTSRSTILILVACGALVMFAFVGIIAAIAVPNLFAARRAANEASAISKLREVLSAQETYRTLEDRYADMGELSRRELIDAKLASGESNGYKFEVTVVGENFWATATPVSYGSSGTRSFLVASDGVIRAADRKGLKARPDDTPLGDGKMVLPGVPRPRPPLIIDPGGRVSWREE